MILHLCATVVVTSRERASAKLFSYIQITSADERKAMDVQRILQELRDQRGRLDTAISALESAGSRITGRRGRPPKASSRVTRRGPRTMSAAARAKIAAAQRARWAKRKREGVRKAISAKAAVPKKQSRRRGISPAARRRLSRLMKQRWAARRKKQG